MKPGIHTDLSMAAYLRLPAVSASLIRGIVDRCPRAAWAESWLNPEPLPDDATAASDAGSIAHEILLEGSESCCEVIDPNDHPARTTGTIPDGWTNASIRAARDAARAAGKIPVLAPAMDEIRVMVASAQRFINGLQTTEPAIWRAFQDGGASEVTMLWDDAGTLCRMRPDRISAERDLVVDLKFTQRSAEPESWSRAQLIGMGYATSAGFYRRGLRRLFDVDASYIFMVVENMPPYLCSLVGLDPAWTAYGDSRVRHGLALWRRCVERNEWPGYPARVAYPELPGWLAQQMEEQDLDALESGALFEGA